MAYNELIKSFSKMRGYMRDFYLYGFYHRNDFDASSARSYDDSRRRLESWLGDYMQFRYDDEGKRVFLSMDSRAIPHNPLYKAFKAKTFTDFDIAFHFYLMDLLAEGEKYNLVDLISEIRVNYFDEFDGLTVDESSIRKKLDEYAKLGIIKKEKSGNKTVYSIAEDNVDLESFTDAIAFYSEVAPVGVIGSFLLDKMDNPEDYFCFKHHYMEYALDSEILCNLLVAMQDKVQVDLELNNVWISKKENAGNSSKNNSSRMVQVVPLKIYISAQNGRRYLFGANLEGSYFRFYRLDSILSVKAGKEIENIEEYHQKAAEFVKHLWGVATNPKQTVQTVELILHIEDDEMYILQRLEREKRCGSVKRIEDHRYLFSAEVYEPMEMFPWLRTFIGRIVSFKCSDKELEKKFYDDLEKLNQIYAGE